MSTYDKVWLSSEAQLTALADAYGRSTLLRKLTGAFEFPPHTTYLRGVLTPWMRAPTVFTAEGVLSVADDRIEFRARTPKVFGSRIVDSHDTLAFELSPADVVSVEPYQFSSPFSKIFDLPFTRLRTRKPGVVADLLLCVGHAFSPPKIRERSLALRAELQHFVSASRPVP